MKLLLLDAETIATAVSMRDAVEEVGRAFRALSSGEARAPERGVVSLDDRDGTVLLMGAFVPPGALTAKTVSIFHRNADRGIPVVNGLVTVLDPDTGEPVALCDGTFLTALRTGAASGAATAALARPEARVGCVIGCGAQARTQVLGIDAVRDLTEIRVVARDAARVDAFVADLESATNARLVAVSTPAAAVCGADVVCAATNSSTPVFDGGDLRSGAHVNGIGSFTLSMRELDEATIARARVVVDHRPAALAEAGELVAAEAAGVTSSRDWAELGEVLNGTAEGRTSSDQVTLFKSVGQAVQDSVIAALAVDCARNAGLGRIVEF